MGARSRGFRLTQPVINPQIRQNVPYEQVGPAIGLSNRDQDAGSDQEPEITQCDQLGIFSLVQWAGRIEVVNTSTKTVLLSLPAAFELAFVEIVTGNIGHEICWPASELSAKKTEGCEDWGLFRQLGYLMNQMSDPRGIVFPSLWHENHVSLNVPSGLMVLAMRDLP
jgi:hypothetical protein